MTPRTAAALLAAAALAACSGAPTAPRAAASTAASHARISAHDWHGDVAPGATSRAFNGDKHTGRPNLRTGRPLRQ